MASSSCLFGVKLWDPVVFATAPRILNVIALLAVWLPAACEPKIDPRQLLRAEQSETVGHGS